jgi:two-component system nitrate/nitrite response regulator NarL
LSIVLPPSAVTGASDLTSRYDPSNTRIVIYDQDPQELLRLRESFSQHAGLELVGAFSIVDDAIAAIRIHHPAIAIVSLDNPADAVTLVSRVVADNLTTRFVFLCNNEFAELITNGETIMARGDAVSVLPEYVKNALALAWTTPSLETNKEAEAGNGTEVTHETLTAREREIMHFLVDGHSNKAIARKLNITEGTVKVHVHNILRKLAVGNRRALMTTARR